MISFQHPGTRYQVLAAGTLLANKQVEQCVSWHKVGTLCNMNDMPSQALAQLVETRASTFTAFRNGYPLPPLLLDDSITYHVLFLLRLFCFLTKSSSSGNAECTLCAIIIKRYVPGLLLCIVCFEGL